MPSSTRSTNRTCCTRTQVSTRFTVAPGQFIRAFRHTRKQKTLRGWRRGNGFRDSKACPFGGSRSPNDRYRHEVVNQSNPYKESPSSSQEPKHHRGNPKGTIQMTWETRPLNFRTYVSNVSSYKFTKEGSKHWLVTNVSDQWLSQLST
jgi:hypothetical protein